MPGEHTLYILGVRRCQALRRSVSPTRLCSLALILIIGVLQPTYVTGLRPDFGGAAHEVDPHASDTGGTSTIAGSSEDSSSSRSARSLHASGAGEAGGGLGGSHGRETLAYQLGNHEVQKDPDTGCPLPVVDMSRDRYGCVEWWKVREGAMWCGCGVSAACCTGQRAPPGRLGTIRVQRYTATLSRRPSWDTTHRARRAVAGGTAALALAQAVQPVLQCRLPQPVVLGA